MQYNITMLILASTNNNINCSILSYNYNKDSELLKNSHFDLIIMNDIEKSFYLLLLFQQRYSEIQIILGDYFDIDLPTLDYVIINDNKENFSFDNYKVYNNHYQLLLFASNIYYNPSMLHYDNQNYSQYNMNENRKYAVTKLEDIFWDEYLNTLIILLDDIQDLDIVIITSYININYYYKK